VYRSYQRHGGDVDDTVRFFFDPSVLSRKSWPSA
jgi:hypothetical protein